MVLVVPNIPEGPSWLGSWNLSDVCGHLYHPDSELAQWIFIENTRSLKGASRIPRVHFVPSEICRLVCASMCMWRPEVDLSVCARMRACEGQRLISVVFLDCSPSFPFSFFKQVANSVPGSRDLGLTRCGEKEWRKSKYRQTGKKLGSTLKPQNLAL